MNANTLEQAIQALLTAHQRLGELIQEMPEREYSERTGVGLASIREHIEDYYMALDEMIDNLETIIL